jgi:hypothetical protein
LLAATPARSQDPAAPAPAAPAAPPAGESAQSRKPDKSPASDRETHERATRELLQKLPPEKRRRVLDAMKKVWADEDVRAARDDLRRATETYRRTLRSAMEETDPEVRNAVHPLLDRLLKAGLNPAAWSDSPAPEKPAQDSPPRYLRLLGLSGDKTATLTPEERDLLGSVRERVMADPRVRHAATAVATAKADQPRARAQAMQELRRTTRTVAVELEPRLQALLDKAAPPKP